MGLMKPTSGLPKFTANCGFWRHPRWLGADLDELGLFVACLSYCYEHGTDGALPSRTTLAVGLGLPEKQVKRGLGKLVERGALVETPTGIDIDGYLEHNPSAREVAESKERRSKAGKKGAEARWQSDSEPHTNGNASANGQRDGTELDGTERDVAATAASGPREPKRPYPPMLEHCPACDELTIDCRCQQLRAVT